MNKPLRVLFVSGELIAGDLAYRLVQEGCEVKLYIEDESRKDCFDNMVRKTRDWKKDLKWVGKDGLIVFDDVGYGKVQDRLRKKGYQVVGGCEMGDKLEQDREFGTEVLKKYGLDTLKSKNFNDLNRAIAFVKKSKSKWVVKQNGHTSYLNYVGKISDGRDVVSIIKNYKQNKDISSINLQEMVEGVEVGVARFFNGNDWVGPVEINLEHKSLCNGDIGPKTAEMGTVMWYEEDDDFRLFKETLAKVKPFLQKIGFKGDVDIDFIVTEERACPLEFTARFGSPAVHLQDELQLSKWSDFLMALAKGESFELKFKKEKGMVVCICIPPFPYKSIGKKYYQRGVEINFVEELKKSEMDHIHFEEVCRSKKTNNLCIGGSNGYVLYVTGTGKTISIARRKIYNLIDKIIVPKMFYRTDIGEKFMDSDYKRLRKWKWIK